MEVNVETKICTKCKIEKPVSEFSNRVGGRNGKSPRCRACKANSDAAYRLKNREELLQKGAERYKANKEKFSARSSAYYIKNRERIYQKIREYQVANSEKIAINKAKRYRENKEYRRKKSAEYYKENRGELLYKQKSYTEIISRGYAANLLGIPSAEIPQDLLDLKREQVLMRRLTKQLISTCKEQQK